MRSPAAGVTAAPALYARWFRVDAPDATAADVARTWRMSSPGDREFWTALDAALAAADTAAVLAARTRVSAERLAEQLAVERPQRFTMIRALSSIRASYPAGTMAHDTAHAALVTWRPT
jgi:hypothetical protein